MSFAPINPPRTNIGACDGGGLTAKPKLPIKGCDEDGLTAKPKLPPTLQCDTLCKGDNCDATKKTSNKTRNIVGAAVLLIGGAILGYGHRNIISKGINNVKTSVSKFFADGKAAEFLQKGKDVVAKAKDAIFVKS